MVLANADEIRFIIMKLFDVSSVLILCCLVPSIIAGRHPRRSRLSSRRTSCAAGEVYYASDDGCYALHQRGPCRMNQQLYEGHRKEGLCDCLPDLGLVYSESDDRCYALNIQGPCRNGHWWILKDNGHPACQKVPRGCPADGHHVFWRISDAGKHQCWRLGSQGPCPEGKTLSRDHSNGSLQLSCKSVNNNVVLYHIAHAPYRDCPIGSRRNRNSQCRPAW